MSIYLDEAATSKPKQEVVDTVINLLKNDCWYNPNSVYEDALKCRRIIEKSREVIAEKINCLPEEIIFVPSASCANTLAIIGYLDNKENDCHNLITTSLEHSSIYNIESRVSLKWKTIVKCNEEGLLNPEDFKDYRNCLFSICGCSSEIGTIQPIKEIVELAHKNNNVIHSDLTAYLPHIKVNVKELGVDMASFSSHKIGGLKNCGVLYVKNGIKLAPIVFGHGLFSGTPDIYQISAMAKAFELLDYKNEEELRKKRDYLLDKLLMLDGVYLNGNKEKRLSNNINIRVENISLDNQQMVSMMDLLGHYISSGSACNSGNKEPSTTLLSLGLTPEQANKSIRITLSNDNTYEELDKFYNDFKNMMELYKK